MTHAPTTFGICSTHGMHAGGPCAQCAAERPPHLLALIHELRDTIGTLESRLADKDTEIVALRRRVNELEQGNANRQRAHNTLVQTVDSNGRQIDMLEQQARRRDTAIDALKAEIKNLVDEDDS